MSSKQKTYESLTGFLPYIFLIIGLSLLLVSLSKKKTVAVNGIESSDQASVRRLNEERVNRYLKDAYNRKQLEEIRAKNDFGRTNPAAEVPSQGAVPSRPVNEYSGGDLETEDKWSIEAISTSNMTPEEYVQYQLKLKQDELYRAQQEREGFIAQFIENARRNGFEVQVDQNLKVKSVKKIRQ
ncbi:MAG: hypothetical protein SGJ18_06165 [Pseudomonadota bacterium]|nr:hypothetical protein [Pseudomonadota bacterium]